MIDIIVAFVISGLTAVFTTFSIAVALRIFIGPIKENELNDFKNVLLVILIFIFVYCLYTLASLK